MPYIFKGLFQKYKLDIICEIDQLDILRFTSNVYFKIEDMSYNLILLTGFYYHNFEGHYIVSVSATTSITFADTVCNTQQWCIPKTFITPADANTQVYVEVKDIHKDIEVKKVNGRYYYHPKKHGEYEIPVWIKKVNRVF